MQTTYDPAAKPGSAVNYDAHENETSPIMGVPHGSGMTSSVMGTPIYGDNAAPELKNRFVANGYKDVWATGLFVIQIIATIAVAAVNLKNHSDELKKDTTTNDDNSDIAQVSAEFIIKMLVAAAAGATALAALALGLMRAFPNGYIIGANVLTSLMFVGIGGYTCTRHWDGAQMYGAFWIIIGLLTLGWLYLVRRRIPFSGMILKNAVTLTTRHYGSVVTSFLSLFVLLGYAVVYVLMTTPSMKNFGNDVNGSDNSKTTSSGLVLFLFVLMFYWTTQVIVNVVHVTACGTVATWYFAGEQQMPRNPSLASLKRAVTTSFGSICLGSLIVAFLKMILAMLRSAARNSRAGFLQLVALCFLGCMERLVEMFNVYAFSHVAIYGSSFIEAAKQTWELVKNCGFTGIINDCMVYNTLSITNFVCSLLIGTIVGFTTSSKYDGTTGIALGVLAFFVSFVIFILLLRVVYAATVTIFVCYAENQEVASVTNPIFAEDMRQAIYEMAPRQNTV